MRFNFRLFIFLVLLFCINLQSSKANLFRDAETEEVIQEIIKPVQQEAGLKNLKIYLLDDPEPNAFTIGGNKIFIHSGLIIDFPDPDVLRGVLAHEIGHIIGQHISRRAEVIDNSKYAVISSMALGIGAALAGSGDGAIAAMLAGIHIADRSVFSYSRELESSADQKAFKLLESSSHSAIGMLTFFETVKPRGALNYVNQYELTHPLTSDRISILRNVIKRSKFPQSQNTDLLNQKYKRVSVKLAAFTKKLEDVEILDYSNEDPELEYYKESIKFFRKGNKSEALNYINKLIIKHADDPFYHELKAQIFLQNANYVSVSESAIALAKRPDNDLLKLTHAISILSENMDAEEIATTASLMLKDILKNDKNNLVALYYLSRYYEHYQMQGSAYLVSAQIAYATGRIKDAQTLAKAAQSILEKNSPDWYKADDILTLTNP